MTGISVHQYSLLLAVNRCTPATIKTKKKRASPHASICLLCAAPAARPTSIHHWQLRDLISPADNEQEFYCVHDTCIYSYNADTKQVCLLPAIATRAGMASVSSSSSSSRDVLQSSAAGVCTAVRCCLAAHCGLILQHEQPSGLSAVVFCYGCLLQL
jgi:hypothetical protein